MLREIRFERPALYAKQFEAIYEPKRISCIEASTKAGKTSGCIAWETEQAFSGRSGWNYWWVAPTSDQASIAFRRMQQALEPGTFTPALSHPQHITLLNGAVVWFKSGDKPNSLYGEDVYAAVVDEASRMKEDAWIALRSTLTYTEAPVRIIGNVHGRKNWFYQMARRAQRAQELVPGGDPEIAYHKITAHDAVAAGVLSAKEIEDARSQMPEQAWRELFLAEAADDGGNPFGLDHIQACIKPLSSKPVKSWGWDFAKQRDYTVGIGLDEDGVVAKFERFHHRPWGETMNTVCTLSRGIRALGDSTGLGDPVVEGIQRQLGQTDEGTFQGYHFTPASKQKLMEGLAVSIQARRIGFPAGVIVSELEQFEYEFTRTGVRYSCPEGYFDDCVCALALADMCRVVVPQMVRITPDLLARAAAMPRRRQH